MLIPCHNETLDWVDSATDAPRHGGFNAFGRAVIGECNRLGMIVDGAHVSHEGIRRLLDVSEAPILLSHSNAFSLCDHPRNAPDDVLRRLKDNGGVVHGDLRARLRLAGLARLAQALARRLRQGAARRRSQGPARRIGDAPRRRAARDADRGRRPHRLSRRDAGVDHVGIGSDFFGGAQPVRPRTRRPLPLSLRRTDPARLFRARPRPRSPRATSCASCARSSRSAKCCARRASRRSAGSRIIRGRERRHLLRAPASPATCARTPAPRR